MSAIIAATGGPLLGEIPCDRHSFNLTERELPLSGALAAAADTYHLHVIRRGNRVVFLRRLTHPEEKLGLELEELRATASDIDQMVTPYYPRIDFNADTRDKMAWVENLTPQQLQATRGEGGLRFTDLARDQRAAWQRINGTHYFDIWKVEIGRLAEAMRNWPRTSFSLSPIPLQRDGVRRLHLMIHTPCRYEREGVAAWDLGDVLIYPSPPEGPLAGRVVELSPDSEPYPTALNRKLRFTNGEASLPELVRALESATGRQFKFPRYARGRRLLAYVNDHPAGEVLAMLCELYGWTARPEERGRTLSLGRARVERSRNMVELHARLRQAVPPLLMAQFTPISESGRSRNIRLLYQRAQKYRELTDRLGANWTTASISEFDEPGRLEMANLTLEGTFQESFPVVTALLRPMPPMPLATPELGYFKLEGELGPGKRASLMFWVDGQNGAKAGWGWAIGGGSKPPGSTIRR